MSAAGQYDDPEWDARDKILLRKWDLEKRIAEGYGLPLQGYRTFVKTGPAVARITDAFDVGLPNMQQRGVEVGFRIVSVRLERVE